MSSIWSEDRVTEVARLYEAGKSAAETAAHINNTFGISVTRNAVIGIWNRRGLTGTRQIIKREPRQRRKHDGGAMRRRVRIVRANGNSDAMKVFDFEAGGLREVRAADVIPLHLNLADLEAGQCRYPYGDGPFTFCGCEAMRGKPYCAPHHSLTWTRRREPLPKQQTAPFKILGSLLGSFA